MINLRNSYLLLCSGVNIAILDTLLSNGFRGPVIGCKAVIPDVAGRLQLAYRLILYNTIQMTNAIGLEE